MNTEEPAEKRMCKDKKEGDLLLGTNRNRVESSRDVVVGPGTNSNEDRGHNAIVLLIE